MFLQFRCCKNSLSFRHERLVQSAEIENVFAQTIRKPCLSNGIKAKPGNNGLCVCDFSAFYTWNGTQCVCKNGLNGLFCNIRVCQINGFRLCAAHFNEFTPCGTVDSYYSSYNYVTNVEECACSSIKHARRYEVVREYCNITIETTLKPVSTTTTRKYVRNNDYKERIIEMNRYDEFTTATTTTVDNKSSWNGTTIAICLFVAAVVVIAGFFIYCGNQNIAAAADIDPEPDHNDVERLQTSFPNRSTHTNLPRLHNAQSMAENYPFLSYLEISQARSSAPNESFESNPRLPASNLLDIERSLYNAGSTARTLTSHPTLSLVESGVDIPPPLYNQIDIPQTPPPSYAESVLKKPLSKGSD